MVLRGFIFFWVVTPCSFINGYQLISTLTIQILPEPIMEAFYSLPEGMEEGSPNDSLCSKITLLYLSPQKRAVFSFPTFCSQWP
jgi:hypothetical protein